MPFSCWFQFETDGQVLERYRNEADHVHHPVITILLMPEYLTYDTMLLLRPIETENEHRTKNRNRNNFLDHTAFPFTKN